MRQSRSVNSMVRQLRQWRAAESTELPFLASQLREDDPEVKKVASGVLAAFGLRAARFADDIAESMHANDSLDRESMDSAVWALSIMRDRRSLAPILDRLRAVKFSYRLSPVYFPEEFNGFDPPTLSEVLVPCVDSAAELMSIISHLLTDHRASTRLKEQLLVTLEDWGSVAATAAADVASLLGTGLNMDSIVARTLATVGVAAEETVVEALDRCLAQRPPQAVEIAYAWWRVTGQPQPALDALGRALEDGRGYYVRYIARMGHLAEPLLPGVRELLQQRMATRVEAAYAIWRISDNGSETRQVLTEAIRPLAEGRWRPFVIPALQYMAEVGSAASETEELLAIAVKSPRRFHGLRGGWRTIADDLETCRLAKIAITAIQGSS